MLSSCPAHDGHVRLARLEGEAGQVPCQTGVFQTDVEARPHVTQHSCRAGPSIHHFELTQTFALKDANILKAIPFMFAIGKRLL
jgi:hypothetical protein